MLEDLVPFIFFSTTYNINNYTIKTKVQSVMSVMQELKHHHVNSAMMMKKRSNQFRVNLEGT